MRAALEKTAFGGLADTDAGRIFMDQPDVEAGTIPAIIAPRHRR
jgi:hypothetical protein